MARQRIKLPADNLLHGVSQQAETKQSLNNCRESINITPSNVYGNTKRPSAKFKSRLDLPSGTSQGFAEHFYTRDNAESYLVVNTGSDIRVFDQETGIRQTVAAPDGLSYLTSTGTPSEDFCFLTLGDYTFVCNKTVEVALNGTVTPSLPTTALLYLTQGDYAATYKVFIDGTEQASVTTSEDAVAETSTDFIVQALKTELLTNLSGQPYTVTGEGSVLILSRTDGSDFEVTVTDSISNDAIRAVRGSIQRFEELPDRAPDGYTVKVTRTGGVDVDDFYVRFEADDSTNPASEGVWVETVGPDVQYSFNASTMPHVLVRESDGTFTFRENDWDTRQAGDDNTVPPPSFIGRRINWLYFFQNRLGFLAGGNMITSRTSDYFNFWRKSARTKLDTDPVDVAATTETALNLLYAYPFDEKLVVFGDRALLFSRGGSKYTPATAALDVSEEYELDGRTAPVSVGNSLFYTIKNGSYLAVMEAQASEDNQGRLPTAEVTQHVPKYIPSGAYRMCATMKPQMLLMIPKEGGDIFAYHWLRSGSDLALSSWRRFSIGGPATPWGGSFTENRLKLLAPHAGTHTVTTVTFDEDGIFTPGLDDVHLDYLSEGSVSYDEVGDETTVQVPLVYATPMALGLTAEGAVEEIQGDIQDTLLLSAGASPTSSLWEFKVSGEYTRVVVGEAFNSEHHFSRPYPLRFGPRGEMIADLTRRIQVTKLTINMTQTGTCEVLVIRPDRDTRTETFTGLSVGGEPTLVGGTPISSGPFKVGLRGKTEELDVRLVSNSWMPLCFDGAEWAGSLLKKL